MTRLAEEPVVEEAATNPNAHSPNGRATASDRKRLPPAYPHRRAHGHQATPCSQPPPLGSEGTLLQRRVSRYWRWPVEITLTLNDTTPKGQP